MADLGARRSGGDPDAGQKAGAPTGAHRQETYRREAHRHRQGGAPTVGRGEITPIYAQPRLLEQPVPADALKAADLPDLHFFASFRSPYTWISTERVIRLAEAFGGDLRIRFVLPMVMRGLPVKRSKRVYILLDAAREAKRNGVQFGPISDPVGKPVERGYSLLPWAIEQGRGIEYFRSFMTLVFSQAVDAGSDRGLRRIVEEADWIGARVAVTWMIRLGGRRRSGIGRSCSILVYGVCLRFASGRWRCGARIGCGRWRMSIGGWPAGR